MLAVGMPVEKAPSGWHWRLLTELSRLETGHTPSRRHPEYWDGDIPWIGIRDATGNHGRTLLDTEQHVTQAGIDNSSARLLPTNTVCLSRTASVGYVVVMGRPMATSQDFVNWVCDPELLDFRYLKYALLAERASYSRFSHGTTHQTIYFPEVKAFHICLPSRATQSAIADALTVLDDKIEQNRRTARALERLARAIFRAWFVDFEPVKARAAGATAFPSMPQPVFDALPTRFVDSAIGPVPEGWEVTSVYDLAEVTYGAPFSSKLFNDQHAGRPLIRIRDLQTHEPTTFTTEQHPKGALIRPADIVVGMDGEFRLHYWLGPAAWLNQRLCRLEAKPGVPRMFLGELLRSPLEYFERAKTGTTVIHLGKADIDTFRVLRPSTPVLDAFGEVTDSLLELFVHAARESRNLAEMRDYLLPGLLSGQVRVEVAHG